MKNLFLCFKLFDEWLQWDMISPYIFDRNLLILLNKWDDGLAEVLRDVFGIVCCWSLKEFVIWNFLLYNLVITLNHIFSLLRAKLLHWFTILISIFWCPLYWKNLFFWRLREQAWLKKLFDALNWWHDWVHINVLAVGLEKSLGHLRIAFVIGPAKVERLGTDRTNYFRSTSLFLCHF